MSLWKIAWRNLQHRALASTLTTLSMALGVALVVAVLVMHSVIGESFRSNSRLGYNLVVGPRGGRLDLVLNTVYYLSRPVGTLPWTYYQQFAAGKYKPYVAVAVPVCLGDYFQEYRVVATTPDMFGKLDMAGKKYEFSAGANFRADDYFSGVVGATVAREAGLKVGDSFQPRHGVGPDAHAHDEFRVVGTLAPTGTPVDRAVFVNIEGFYLINDHAKPVPQEGGSAGGAHDHGDDEHEHDGDGEHAHDDDGEQVHEDEQMHEEGDDELPLPLGEGRGAGEAGDGAAPEIAGDEAAPPHPNPLPQGEGTDHEHTDHDQHAHAPLPIEQREVSAILVLNATMPGSVPEALSPGMAKMIDQEGIGMAVFPVREISQLFDNIVGPVRWLLLGLTVLIVVVSGVGMLVSIYNSMAERRHEIAVMRALGARRGAVMRLIVVESLLLALLSAGGGWLLGHALTAALSPWVSNQTGVTIGFLHTGWFSLPLPGGTAAQLPDLAILPILVIPAMLAGYLPALLAYRTDVAKALQATP